MKLRKYQTELAEQGAEILSERHIVYLSFQMRVGKTLTALEICKTMNFKNVLFVTKKKAIKSIENDYEQAGYDYKLTVINYESLHKANNDYDCIIADEAHGLGAFPKPSLRTKRLKEIVGGNYLILLSGTPTPESYSQIFHQFWISELTPFSEYSNFYKWAKNYVVVRQRKINGMLLNDYKKAKIEEIEPVINPYLLTYTQEEAGFEQKEIEEKIITVRIDPKIKRLMDYLLEYRVYYFKRRRTDAIVCDSAVKLQQKLHQLASGTIISEDGNYLVLGRQKAEYIHNTYEHKRIAIFYKFQAERTALEAVLGSENVTDIPERFNEQSGNRIKFLSQIRSGAMGINLSTADYLIFYNIDFSSELYWQARERIQSMDRQKRAIVHWIFSDYGIEEKIYKQVLRKKDYTTYYFKKDFNISAEQKAA